jgi:hypothetical protein
MHAWATIRKRTSDADELSRIKNERWTCSHGNSGQNEGVVMLVESAVMVEEFSVRIGGCSE